MRAISTCAVAFVAVLTAFTAQGLAITNGEQDNSRHPGVGIIAWGPPTGCCVNPICSGSLVAPDVFLTAGHCLTFFDFLVARGFPLRVWVSFDEDYPSSFDPDRSGWFPVKEWHIHPDYTGPGAEQVLHRDIGVLILDLANKPSGLPAPPPMALPPLAMLDALSRENGLRGQVIPVVGYGLDRTFPPPGPSTFSSIFDLSRHVADSEYLALTPEFLIVSQNPNTGDGGTCSGDSGGPNLLGDTDLIVGVTSSGDRPCRAMGTATRTDTVEFWSFVGQFVTAP